MLVCQSSYTYATLRQSEAENLTFRGIILNSNIIWKCVHMIPQICFLLWLLQQIAYSRFIHTICPWEKGLFLSRTRKIRKYFYYSSMTQVFYVPLLSISRCQPSVTILTQNVRRKSLILYWSWNCQNRALNHTNNFSLIGGPPRQKITHSLMGGYISSRCHSQFCSRP